MSNGSFSRQWRDSLDDDLAVKFLRELVASSPTQRNWRGIGIALVVILVVCALIVTAVVVLTPPDSGPRVKGEKFTLDDVLGGNFSTPSFNGTWISDNEFIYQDHTNALMLYNADIKNATLLVPSSPLRRFDAQMWFLSPDRRFLLFAYNLRKVFRYSFLALYTVYDLQTQEIHPLTPEPGQESPLQYAAWNPVGNSLVFVFQNNIYYKPVANKEDVLQLTGNNLEEHVFNGIPDWVYEEEIISSNHALWFSKNGKMLSFASFNDSAVPTLNFEWYGSVKQPFIYPLPEMIRYPKPATPNPTVKIFVVNISSLTPESNKIEEFQLPPPPEVTSEHYFTAVKWLSETELSITWMNRRQNLSIITICKSDSHVCSESYREETGDRGWVDLYDPPLFNSRGDKYFIRGSVREGPSGFYRQVVMVDRAAKKETVLTHGKWEVTKIKAYNEEHKRIYYMAAPEGKPGERHLYFVYENDTVGNKTGTCLTCNYSSECLYNDVTFSKNAAYFVLECDGPGAPRIILFDSLLNKEVLNLESNLELKSLIETKALPQERTFRVPIADNYEAQVKLLLPPGLHDNEIKQYPMIVDVYGGPGSQQVSQKFSVNWGSYLASGMDIIYAYIDGRGSGYQGEKRMHELYRRLGTVEVEDQIEVTKYLLENLAFIDKKRVAIWGWSYGGFVTAMVMGNETDIFKCGISVAPVSNWAFYDSVYTERYMGLPIPEDNQIGYQRSDVLSRVNNFKGKEYYLIHGTADDNVHFQQSMMLTKALAEEEIIFRQQVYPDENHSLSSVKKHLYLSLDDFLKDCFNKEPIEVPPTVTVHTNEVHKNTE